MREVDIPPLSGNDIAQRLDNVATLRDDCDNATDPAEKKQAIEDLNEELSIFAEELQEYAEWHIEKSKELGIFDEPTAFA